MPLFILLCLLSHVTVVTAVAGCHSDRDKDHRPRINCTAGGFSDAPGAIEALTQVLLFPNNLFSSLSWSSFQIFTKIYEIDLTGNKLPEVTPTDSPMLSSLRILRLGSNRLTSLSGGSFSACPGLIELYLDNNAIDSLNDHTFSGLSKLEILDLSSNRIKVLPNLLLHPLAAIETLFLENNKIKVMPDDWFSQKEEVPYLFLSANLWVCSCSLDYLRRYLDDYEFNIYTRDGPLIQADAESVACDSPKRLQGTPVVNLEESDLCSPPTELGPSGDFEPTMTTTSYKTTAAAATLPATTIVSSPPPTTTGTPTTAATPSAPLPHTLPPATTPISAATTALVEDQSFTRVIEWSSYSGSVLRSEVPLVDSHTLATHPTLPATRSSSGLIHPAKMTTAIPSETATMAGSVASTLPPSTTLKLQLVKTIPTNMASQVIRKAGSEQRGRVGAVRGAESFCIWLFTGCLLLCLASAVCILVTLARLVIWYRRVYRPLSAMLVRRRGGGEGARLLMHSRREGGGAMALYRTVLFIHREGEDATEKRDGGNEGEGGGGKERCLVTLEPSGQGGMTRDEEQTQRGAFKKTLYRLLSKEEEIEGWREVVEGCRVSAEDVGTSRGVKNDGVNQERSTGEASRKRFSVVLRQEREEAVGGREQSEWVVGRWEVKRGEDEPRSSWGQWLDNIFPSMPWGVTTPPEGEAAQ